VLPCSTNVAASPTARAFASGPTTLWRTLGDWLSRESSLMRLSRARIAMANGVATGWGIGRCARVNHHGGNTVALVEPALADEQSTSAN